MSYRHTLEAALESLHEVEDLITGFSEKGNIPAIEIDLALQKVRNIYELMLMVKKEPASTVKEKPAETITAAVKEEVAETMPEAVKEEVAAVVAEAVKEKPAAKKAKAGTAPQTLADQFKGGTTLHESLHQSFSNEAETLRHTKPVTNLLEAIGINDRYNFIRELFNNDTTAFESAIKFLNDATSFNDAYNYMLLYFNWDMDSEPVQQLLEIIRRKFIKNRNE